MTSVFFNVNLWGFLVRMSLYSEKDVSTSRDDIEKKEPAKLALILVVQMSPIQVTSQLTASVLQVFELVFHALASVMQSRVEFFFKLLDLTKGIIRQEALCLRFLHLLW